MSMISLDSEMMGIIVQDELAELRQDVAFYRGAFEERTAHHIETYSITDRPECDSCEEAREISSEDYSDAPWQFCPWCGRRLVCDD